MLRTMAVVTIRRSTRVSKPVATTVATTTTTRGTTTAQASTLPLKKRKAAAALPKSSVKKVKSGDLVNGVPAPALSKQAKSTYSTGDIDDVTPPPNFALRPTEPHATNVPVHDDIDGSTKVAVPLVADTDTGSILAEAEAHLIQVDARFKAMIAKWRCPLFMPAGLSETIDPFRSLVSGICGQQLSGASAKACKNKFVALFNGKKGEGEEHVWPTPAEVAVTSIDRLRLAGLSMRKAEYIQGLAQKFVDGELTTEMLLTSSDDVVMENLCAVRGLGKWSVEMFMCFGLKRMDVLSVGDLGVEKGMAVWDGRDVAKLKAKGGKRKYMTEKDMIEKSEAYRPYRSLFMWYMWRAADTDISVLVAE